MRFEWNEFASPVWISVQVALAASLIVFVLALAAAKWMAKARFIGKSTIETLLLLPLVLPPTVVGFVLLMLLGRRSWIGEAYEWLLGQPIVFSWTAAVIASVVVAFPLVYRTMKAGFEEVDMELEDAARSQGATEWQLFRWITAPLASRSLTAGYLLGFARSLGEFGATLMIAGNIPNRTQTIPTAIYVAVDAGNVQLAWALAGATVMLSFLMLLAAGRHSKR
ncbi:molybdate ABC transporter permease subunit [Cohnella pontilimi]|uniref:Molybdenum transport system permease n=1 Tax=Cohnella pontilimi TaxID=2564100 RepID=A0A4U0FHI0_9BACL|nr:molybdate ABC transporter permease subunit [Cohnella pontilimi]TJY43884.1 molybdate ABC transporter permease subunit [Cohnella pontilimi]